MTSFAYASQSHKEDSQKKLSLLAENISYPLKQEQLKKESGRTDFEAGVSKEFLFDPFAAAYYSRFSDYMPGKHSLNSLLASS